MQAWQQSFAFMVKSSLTLKKTPGEKQANLCSSKALVYFVSSILDSSVSSLKATFTQIQEDHHFSRKYLQGNQRRLSSHCLFRWDNDRMDIPIPQCFYDLLRKFLTNSSIKNSGRTKDNGQIKIQKILTPHHGKFFPRNRDTEKLSHFARPTWARSGCVFLVQIQCQPCLQQEIRL